MHAKLFLKLSTFYVIMTTAHTASVALYATKRENLNIVFQFPGEAATTNRLLLRDCPSYPFIGNAVDHIRALIVDKLELPHLEWHILQATYTDKGLLFEMSTETDTAEVLESFAIKMRHKDCILKRTFKEFITVQERK